MVKFINYLFTVHDDIPWKLRNIFFLEIIIVIIFYSLILWTNSKISSAQNYLFRLVYISLIITFFKLFFKS